MPQTYTFPLPSDIPVDTLLDRVKAAAKEKSIAFVGDAASGTFRGMVQGSYKVEGPQIVVTVEKKPGFVPWGMVESGLKDLFTK